MTAVASLLGDHELMQQLRVAIERAATSELPVLVVGETGTGKELVVRALHAAGQLAGRLVPVNVATLTEALAEGELFGVERGAYTGAYATRNGLIEHAREGTLFLDESCDLSAVLQVKILRALESGSVRRVGATVERPIRFRLVITVQREPRTLVTERRWRADFLYRVAAIELRVPPLRERLSDLGLLSSHFLARDGRPPLEPPALRLLESHSWPGNVRELLRVLQRAGFSAGSQPINALHVHAALTALEGRSTRPPATELDAGSTHRRIVDRETVARALAVSRTVAEAASLLGITERTLYRKIRMLGLGRRKAGAPRAS